MAIGYDQPLYLLPFDHRASFQTSVFGWKGPLTGEQTAQIAAAKQVIYEGFHSAVVSGVPREKAAILVDEQFGSAILTAAAEQGYATCCPIERSGPNEFDFEFGETFAKHIDACRPAFCKVQVCYNPEADRALNSRQSSRLRRLSEHLDRERRSRFMFELLVPPLPAQLQQLKGNERAYEWELRPRLAVQAIEELQDVMVDPDVWIVEGFDRSRDCKKVVAAARRNGRAKVGCIVQGRGVDELRVRHWIHTAAGVPGFIGFAAGGTCFWEPLTAWRHGIITRHAAVAVIARRFRRLADIFESTISAAA